MIAKEDIEDAKKSFQKLDDERKKNNRILLCTCLSLGAICASAYYAGVNKGFRLGANLTATAIHSRYPEVVANAICDRLF